MTYIIVDPNLLTFLLQRGADLRTTYIDEIQNILMQCDAPYTFIESNHNEIFYPFLEDNLVKQFLNSYNNAQAFYPEHYIENLPTDKGPINLYIFLHAFYTSSIKKCQQILEEKNVQIRNVKLYFLGYICEINLHFISIFHKFSQDVYLNFEYKGHISPNFDFKDIDYAFLMKDDSIKLHILSKLILNGIDRNVLRETLYQLYLRISNENFANDKIYPFYVENNVQDCIQFIQKYSEDITQIQFRSKMYNIFRILKEEDLTKVDCSILYSYEYKYNIHSDIKCELITTEALYKNSKQIIFPVHIRQLDKEDEKILIGTLFFEKIIREAENDAIVIGKIINPESYQSFKKIYKKFPTRYKKKLQNVYVLNNGILPFQAVVNHNNAILSQIFPHIIKTKENIILWHMAFLYVLGMKIFPEMRERLFQEIRLLGDSSEYFISLHIPGNPLIIDKINAGFWYIAKISDLAFPIDSFSRCYSKLHLLDFYKNVYDPNHIFPSDMILNRLPSEFIFKYDILNILTHFYDYDTIFPDHSYRNFHGIILYNKPLHNKRPFYLYSCLSSVNLEALLERYQKERKIDENKRQLDVIHDLSKKEEFESVRISLKYKLINLFTVIPDFSCLEYNMNINAYLKVFQKYCTEMKRYPEDSLRLMIFLRDCYWNETKMPVLFESAVKTAFDETLLIFSDLMNTVKCPEYIEIIKNNAQKMYK